MDKIKAVKVARGLEPADLVLKNCRIMNVFTGLIEEGDIAILKDTIVGIGVYTGIEEIDIQGHLVVPGFIDGHVHIESSMLTPQQFAQVVVPKGTTTVIADPHEIGNVCGMDGIEFMIRNSEKLPLDVFVMLPSCVPSTEFENSGANLLARDLEKLIHHPRVLGLGEVMNYPGVLAGNLDVFDKIEMAKGRLVDGHAPGLSGRDLDAYVVAGIRTDHEATTVQEMLEKLGKGMVILIREGSATRNLATLIQGVNQSISRRIAFCTDDKHPEDIAREGHINYNVLLAIRCGLPFAEAIRMATLNTAEAYRLYDRGAIAPSYLADLVVIEDEKNIQALMVFKSGKLVAKDDKALFEPLIDNNPAIMNTVRIQPIETIDLSIKLKTDIVKVIQLVSHNIITKKVVRKFDVRNDSFYYNHKLDIIKLAVIERHHRTGNVGLGFVEGYGLKSGAIGLTIAHDSHNIIVVGCNDEDMKLAISELERTTGGITICNEGKVLKTLTLEVAGLMTNQPIEEVIRELTAMSLLAFSMGVSKEIDPFLTLAFLALPVIPELKLTDQGLFDVTEFKFVDVNE